MTCTATRVALLASLVLAPSLPRAAESTDEDLDEFTIVGDDLSEPGAPRFEDYAIRERFRGAPVPVDLRSHPEARTYRTVLREGARRGPNFAGHMTVVTFGCGTNAFCLAFVDARNGRVYFDERLQLLVTIDVHPDVLPRTLQHRKDSALLIAVGCPNEECETRRGVTYFLWTGRGLKEIHRLLKPWHPRRAPAP